MAVLPSSGEGVEMLKMLTTTRSLFREDAILPDFL
jgi:hypothetical protein